MRAALVFILIGGFAQLLTAQPITKSSYETMLEVAAEALANKDYYNALDYYERAYEEREDPALLPAIADLHLKIRDYTRARRTYARILRADREDQFGYLRFPYAQSLKLSGEYEEAIKEFQLFLETTRNDTLRELAEAEINGAELALLLAKQEEKKIEPERVDRKLLSPFSEYAPVFYRNGNLYFATFNTDEVIVMDDPSGDFYIKIHKADRQDDGWGDPTPLDPKINRPGFHSSSIAFSPDGNTMYFTRAKLQGNVVSESKIYYSVGGDGNWGAANEAVGVNGDWVAMYPAPGELFGRRVLFFASDMDGGFGGLDLYYAPFREDGVFGDPVNLGPKINTPGDEVTPFYFDGTLYFSSNGHPGLGGQDIFFSVWNGSFWSEPQNMGPGLNSSQDDQYFSLDAEGYQGLMTSNRPEGRSVKARTCCDDIYTFEIEKITAALVVGVFDSRRRPLLGANVELLELASAGPNSQDSQTDSKGNRFDFPLELEKAYMVVAKKEGYFPDTARLTTVELKESQVFEERFYLRPIPPPEPPEGPQYDTITIEEPIVMENILYDFDDDKIKTEAEVDLEVIRELMTIYPDMKIELGSHTDARGNDRYNEDLSQRRAQSAVNWLTENGVAEERMVAKGYGETQPKVVTERIAGEYDFLQVGDRLTESFIDSLETEAQREIAHAINRRTEFKIIEGPTSITIRRTQLKSGSAPAETGAPQKQPEAPKQPEPPKLTISELSSLHGVRDLRGLPIMQFRERMVDFGTVKKGEKREHTYVFVNRGFGDLKISIITACECTTIEYDERKTYRPGEGGFIKVIFDSSEKEAAETIDIDIILENEVPATGNPIIERIQYKFDIEK